MNIRTPLLLLLALTAINGGIVAYRHLRQTPPASPTIAAPASAPTPAPAPTPPASSDAPTPKLADPSPPTSHLPDRPPAAKPPPDRVATLDKPPRQLPPLPGSALPPKGLADRIVVEKKARRLTLLRGGKPLKSYDVALGRSPEGPKHFQDDNKTPEGLYQISFRKKNSEFHRALRISYPSSADVAFAAKQNRSPGGDIMIHGLPNGMGWLDSAHRLRDWTAGCIAVTNAEIEEIWRAVPDGTPVEIRP
ncbi:MAG: L,D-transpeptidase family protein [Candidatus Competibacter sp.]|nr:L,D-transpeptidase family protein [Candidatus Competibacter sp.]